jgi:hypothetical protein
MPGDALFGTSQGTRRQVFRQVMYNATFPGNSFEIKYLQNGGDGGIRTLSAPVESVTYRFWVTGIARNASGAVGPCSFLPAEAAVIRRSCVAAELAPNTAVDDGLPRSRVCTARAIDGHVPAQFAGALHRPDS